MLVRDVDIVLVDRPAQDLQMIGAYLVACSPGAAVDHDRNLAFEQAELLCYFLIVDLVHPLDLQEVVAAAQVCRAEVGPSCGPLC